MLGGMAPVERVPYDEFSMFHENAEEFGIPSAGYIAGSTDVGTSAAGVATAVRALAPDARAVVGMSLGGITALALATLAPDLVRSLVLVDVTPGVDEVNASAIMAFVNGPESFASFDDLL